MDRRHALGYLAPSTRLVLHIGCGSPVTPEEREALGAISPRVLLNPRCESVDPKDGTLLALALALAPAPDQEPTPIALATTTTTTTTTTTIITTITTIITTIITIIIHMYMLL